jgi:hypothetical protein
VVATSSNEAMAPAKPKQPSTRKSASETAPAPAQGKLF